MVSSFRDQKQQGIQFHKDPSDISTPTQSLIQHWQCYNYRDKKVHFVLLVYQLYQEDYLCQSAIV